MKAKIVRHVIKVTLYAAVLLAACLFGSLANAQSDLQGKFTLHSETHWARAVLPAGDYVLTFTHDNLQPMLVIRDAKSGLIVAFESLAIREDSTGRESALVINVKGHQRVVQSLAIAEVGERFVYESARTHRREAEEARQTQVVPVLVAKK
jgi:hypothetical protein